MKSSFFEISIVFLHISNIICSYRCNNFFTVLTEINPFLLSSYEPCEDTFVRLDDSFRILSNQMREMNQTLYVFTSYTLNKYCSINYSNIEIVKFFPRDLFEDSLLQQVLSIFEVIYYDDYAKISDIIRILIAEKYSYTYIDLDIHFLNYNHSVYSVEFISMHVWDYQQCSLEITNAIFCLSPFLLQKIRQRMINQIISLNIYKYHTELGPTLFSKALTNINHPIFYYTVNHPESFDISRIVLDIQTYHMHFLHLTSSLRILLQESQTISFEDFIHQIRRELNLKPLNLPSSVVTQESLFQAMKAMHFIHPNHPNHFQLGLKISEILIRTLLYDCDVGVKRQEELVDNYYECVMMLGEIIGAVAVSQTIKQQAIQLMEMLDSVTCTKNLLS